MHRPPRPGIPSGSAVMTTMVEFKREMGNLLRKMASNAPIGRGRRANIQPESDREDSIAGDPHRMA